MKKLAIYLTKTELEQLQSYCNNRDEGDMAGWYYGNKEQFEKRHSIIKNKIYVAIKKLKEGK